MALVVVVIRRVDQRSVTGNGLFDVCMLFKLYGPRRDLWTKYFWMMVPFIWMIVLNTFGWTTTRSYSRMCCWCCGTFYHHGESRQMNE